MTKSSPCLHFKTSPEIIRLAVMLYVRLPLSLRNVEDLLYERGIDISHQTALFGRYRRFPRDNPRTTPPRRAKLNLRAFSWPNDVPRGLVHSLAFAVR